MKPVDRFLEGFLIPAGFSCFGLKSALLVCSLNVRFTAWLAGFGGELIFWSSMVSLTVWIVWGIIGGFLLSREPLEETEQSAGFLGLFILNLELAEDADCTPIEAFFEWYTAARIGFYTICRKN